MASLTSLVNPSTIRTTVLIGSACMALLAVGVRMKAAKKPVSVKKIVMPPLGMATGFLMFLFPQTHIPLTYAGGAMLAGVLFSTALIKSSTFETRDGDVYLKRSKAFLFVLLGLLAARIGAHGWIEQFVSLPQTGAIFYLLAFSMIAPWRVAMLRQFTQLRKEMA